MKPPRPTVAVTQATYDDRLRELARRNGEQIGTTLDAIIRRYLDERNGKA